MFHYFTNNFAINKYQCHKVTSGWRIKHKEIEIYSHFKSHFAFAINSLKKYFNLFSSLSTYTDNDLYTGTDADFSGNDPIIYREPLQTDQFDSMSLNGK